MPVSLIPSFLFYCFITGITPGPANLCTLAAALKYGKGPALRQWRGLVTGFTLISMGAVLVAYFLGEIMDQYVYVLSWVGAAYILWMAFHILKDQGDGEVEAGAACNFTTGLLIQLTNVKIMVFCLTALTTFVLPHTGSFRALLTVGCFLPFTGPLCNLVWLRAGVSLRDLLARRRRPVNIVLAASLALCAVSLVWH